MSAFITSDLTINQILALLADAGQRFEWSSTPNVLAEAGYDLAKPEDLTRLGRDMRRLNEAAILARYGEEERHLYQYDYVEVTDIQAYKSLRCWLYQCAEGNVPKRKLYKLMERIAAMVADGIVSATTEYRAAKWDA